MNSAPARSFTARNGALFVGCILELLEKAGRCGWEAHVLVRVTFGVALIAFAVDLYAFGRMTRRLRKARPAVYHQYFRSGTWLLFFDEGDNTIWTFYTSSAGDDDPVIPRCSDGATTR